MKMTRAAALLILGAVLLLAGAAPSIRIQALAGQL